MVYLCVNDAQVFLIIFITMVEGNQFWKMRTRHGRKKIFSSPEELWKICCEYFEYTDTRRWMKVDYRGKDAERVEIPTSAPYTLKGLRLFLGGIDEQTWINYRTKENYKEFHAIVQQIEDIIYVQKFEGSAVGAYNANIIARELGLADKIESKNENSDTLKIEIVRKQ